MSEQVVVGRMLDPKRIETKDVETISKAGLVQKTSADKTTIDLSGWDHRARWSYLRLQFGRVVDAEISAHMDAELEKLIEKKIKITRELSNAIFDEYFDRKAETITDPREVQWILEKDYVMAVASLQHLLLPPDQVYGMAEQIIKKKYPRLLNFAVDGLQGATYEVKSVAGYRLGLQVFGGDITTRNAITVTSWLRVEMCFNPLSWLGSGAFRAFTGSRGSGHEKLLRIKVLTDLRPRLEAGIEGILNKQHELENRVAATKKIKVKRSSAEIIMAALGLSYQLGGKTVEQILDQLKQEPKTQWGMSMASSYVAAHGKFKETPEGMDRKVEQKLSTLSGAALMLDDIKDAKEKSLEWLQTHIQEGQVKTVDELIKRLGIKKVEKQ